MLHPAAPITGQGAVSDENCLSFAVAHFLAYQDSTNVSTAISGIPEV